MHRHAFLRMRLLLRLQDFLSLEKVVHLDDEENEEQSQYNHGHLKNFQIQVTPRLALVQQVTKGSTERPHQMKAIRNRTT